MRVELIKIVIFIFDKFLTFFPISLYDLNLLAPETNSETFKHLVQIQRHQVTHDNFFGIVFKSEVEYATMVRRILIFNLELAKMVIT